MKKLSTRKRLAVISKTGGKCAYCGKPLDMSVRQELGYYDYAFDHIIPKSKGGESSVNNLLFCCKRCNSEKATKSLEEFRFVTTLKKYRIPYFSKEQVEFLASKIDLNLIFPESIKFYFERENVGE